MQVIGVDPHKGSHTAVAISVDENVIKSVRVESSRRQVDRLLAFAAEWPERVWAVEGAAGVGRLLAQQLVARGERVVDVPPSLSTRVRVLSGRSGRKTDAHDARAVAIVALHSPNLVEVTVEDFLTHRGFVSVHAQGARDVPIWCGRLGPPSTSAASIDRRC